MKPNNQGARSRERVWAGVGPGAPSPTEGLYRKQVKATRNGPLYGAFPYPTKISPEAVALFIGNHTNPGDTVFDGFAGSGTTGLAALLCGDPPIHLRKEAESLGLNVNWGARNAVLYEIGALGSLVARTLTNPPSPENFRKAACEILNDVAQAFGWMYYTKDPDGSPGKIRYTVWSDLLVCPFCETEVPLWDACVRLRPASIGSEFTCPNCSHVRPLDHVERSTSTCGDDILDSNRTVRKRHPARIYGRTGKRSWARPASADDIALLGNIDLQPIPESVPRTAIPWGDLYRRGYHTGISHVHHFYTRRNLIAFGQLWERSMAYDPGLRDALCLWLLSYNSAHSTLMTRVVAKAGQDELVVTSAQPGVLYVSGLPVEKNIFEGLRRKLATIGQAFEVIHGRRATVEVYESSSCRVALPDASIDYAFTDPPFGGNIPYAEVNFINEAWLGRLTNRADEVIISDSQGKTSVEYADMLTQALTEVNRILKPEGKATLIFHSASSEVWNALQSAYTSAGFGVECVGVLNKTQSSFKQATTAGAVKGDPVLLLAKAQCGEANSGIGAWAVASRLWKDSVNEVDSEERTPQRLYSRLINYFLVNHERVSVDAAAFYRWYASQDDLRVNTGAAG